MAGAADVMMIKVLDKEKLNAGESLVKKFVFLPVNPRSVSFSIPKTYSEVKVSTPLRVVIQDWGTGMIEIVVNAVTGRILPFAEAFEQIKKDFPDITYEELISFAVSEEVESFQGKDVWQKVDALSSFLLYEPKPERDLRRDLVSGDFLSFSRYRYLMMKLLEDIYMRFDANADVMVLEWMKGIYHGIMTNFEYTLSVESLWNIRFNFTFRAYPSFFETVKVNEKVLV